MLGHSKLIAPRPFCSIIVSIDTFLKTIIGYGLNNYFRFKNSLNFNHLPSALLSKSIEYVLLTRFPFLLSEGDLSLQIKECSLQLKRIYQSTRYERESPKNKFQCLMIVAVKVIVYFIESHFYMVEIEKDLQADLYVILVNLLIGIQVTPKAYSILLSMHLKAEVSFPTVSFETALNSASQPPREKQRLTIRSMQRGSRFVRGRHMLGKGRSSINGRFSEQLKLNSLDEFKFQVKDSLRVEVERGKPQKRIRLTTLERLRCDEPKEIKKKNKSHISSEQISVTLESQLAVLNLQRVFTNKNIIMKQKFSQINTPNYILTPRISCRVSCDEEPSKKQEGVPVIQSKKIKKLTQKDWSALLLKIKKDYNDTRVAVERRI